MLTDPNAITTMLEPITLILLCVFVGLIALIAYAIFSPKK